MRSRIPPAERLARRSVPDAQTGCINWTGSMLHNGYGHLVAKVEGIQHGRAHRVAYALSKGPIPPGMQIDHLCRNRRCVNPAHLECVTREENIARGNAPNVLNAKKTHCKRGHELSPGNIRIGKEGRRICLPCHRLRAKIYRSAK